MMSGVVARRVVEFRLVPPPRMTETRNALSGIYLANGSKFGLTIFVVGLWTIPMSIRPL